jgi:DNA mismatch repair protein MutS
MMNAIDENIFEVGYDERLDGHQTRIEESLEALRAIHTKLNPALVKMETTEKEGVIFVTTEKRYVDAVGAAADRGEAGSILKGKKTAANVRITTHEADALNKEYVALRDIIRIEAAEAFTRYFEDFVANHRVRLVKAIGYVERVDYLCANAHNAARHRLVRPTVAASESDEGLLQQEESYVECKELRHPIIEHVQHSVKYVPNDVALNADTRGVILYGINAAGKSSLMKSIGIGVIMAQCGMFVAADRFEYRPYDSVFTRILNVDNLYKRQSTFTAEMSELRTILQCATPNSLVIGDELCKMEEITGLETVSIKHLSVNYEEATNHIVYDRKLKDGPGDTLYGLEVCRSLDLDKDFMRTANEVRKRLLGMGKHIVSNSPSRYNTMKYKDVCSVCKDNVAHDMHHIEYQRTADDKGYINHYHKNRFFNLVALCNKCHDDVHHNKMKIEGYIDTSEGVVLNIR